MVEPKTIYLEPDEEVTSVIDKIRKTEFKDVILVVPKEASLLQSVVNLKLIKKQAENLGKNLSIITQDKVGRNLADKVGLATAAKVGQEPRKKENTEDEAPQSLDKADEGPIESTDEVVYKEDAKDSGLAEDELVVSEDDESEADWSKKEIEEKPPTNLMPKFPKKKLLLIGIPVILLILILGYIFLPRAKVTIYVKAEKKPISVDISGEKDAKLNTDKAIIPSQSIEVTKETSKKYPATGKKNIGTKATGSVKIINTSPTEDISWTAGTRLYPEGKSDIVFRTSAAVNITPAQTSQTVSVEADQPGDQYNGFSNVVFYSVTLGSKPNIYTATSMGGMAGGSNKEVTFVTQGDINTAKDNLSKEALDNAKTEFNKKAETLKVIDDSKVEEVLSATSNPAVNSEASEFSLTTKVSIKALAYNMDDINKILKAEVERQYGYAKQIVNDGVKTAEVDITSSDLATGKFSASVKTDAYVASKIDQSQIKDELKGKSASKATDYLKGIEGVEESKFQFWPSFIKFFPRLKSNIYLSIQIPEGSKN
ncbi:MAG: hypothetical protein WCI63_02865 [bacterium]